MSYLKLILIYPIKALDGIEVSTATILESGALEHDRAFAILDRQGNYVNGKNNPKVHQLRAVYDLSALTVKLNGVTFKLEAHNRDLETWLSDYFAEPVEVWENLEMGFPDDTEANAATVISTATLETVASWFTGLSLAETRSRFRMNLEISGVPAFWEDRLFSEPNQGIEFKIGTVHFQGINPCQRCVVPIRNSLTGEVDKGFQKTFSQKRRETLPSFVNTSWFNHYYRLGVNTKTPPSQGNQQLAKNDLIEIIGNINNI